MIPSAGGCFELTVGGKKLYSKLKTGTFPDEDELAEAVGKAIGLEPIRRGLQWTFLRRDVRGQCTDVVGAADPRRRRRPLAVCRRPTAPIHERDIAAVAVRALLEPGHDGAEYVLSGPESLSQLAQVSTIGEVIGRSLRYEEISPEEALRELPFRLRPSGCCWMRGQPRSVSLPTSRPRSRRSPGSRPVDSATG